MSSYNTLLLSPILQSKYATRLAISNPPLNLVDSLLLTELHSYLTALLQTTDGPKVVVISSTVSKVWISHLDLHIISAQHPPSNGDDPAHLIHLLGEIIRLFSELPVIFIAEVDGLAVGGGNEFAVNMDMRFAGPRAKFGIPEVAGGVVHGGGLQRLTKIVGPGQAMEMMLSAQGLSGEDAARIGLANRATNSSAHLRTYVDALAARIALFPRSAIEATKAGVRECLQGKGSMAQDMQRLVELAHTEKAQDAVSKLIEFGEGDDGHDFELSLPDSEIKLWI